MKYLFVSFSIFLFMLSCCDDSRSNSSSMATPNAGKVNDDVNKPIRIITIAYSHSACFGTCPVFSMSIDSNREAVYVSEEYSGKPGTYKAILDTTSYYDIVGLLIDLDIRKLHDKYYVGITDQSTSYLTITYNNNKTKEIEDYGDRGTKGLALLYDKIFKLRETQKWKKIKQ